MASKRKANTEEFFAPTPKRKHLSIPQKLDIIDKVDYGVSIEEIAKDFNISKATVNIIYSSKAKFTSFVWSGSKKEKPTRDELDSKVYSWFQHQRSRGKVVRGVTIARRASLIYKRIGLTGKFTDVQEWVERFTKKYKIELKIHLKRLPQDLLERLAASENSLRVPSDFEINGLPDIEWVTVNEDSEDVGESSGHACNNCDDTVVKEEVEVKEEPMWDFDIAGINLGSLKEEEYYPSNPEIEDDIRSALGHSHRDEDLCPSKAKRPTTKILPMTEQELEKFYKALHQANPRTAVLSILPKYARNFLPEMKTLELPKPLKGLYQMAYLAITDLEELLVKCREAFQAMKVTQLQAFNLELRTERENKPDLVSEHMAGRILPMLFKTVICADVQEPPQDVIKYICYPEPPKADVQTETSGKTTEVDKSMTSVCWPTCEHIDIAKAKYLAMARLQHQNLNTSSMGLHIDPNHPHLGASADAKLTCTCCGEGLLRIQCHICATAGVPWAQTVKEQMVYLDGHKEAKRLHSYNYEAQAALNITNSKYYDLLIFSKDYTKMERIYPDEFFLKHCMEKVTKFYIEAVMPELLGKWYTVPRVSDRPHGEVTTKQVDVPEMTAE